MYSPPACIYVTSQCVFSRVCMWYYDGRPSTPTMASAVSAAARSDQNGAPGGAGAHVRPEERIRQDKKKKSGGRNQKK